MSISSQLEPLVRRTAIARATTAGLVMAQRLDNAVPRDTGATARSQRVRPSIGSRSVAIAIEYPTPLANILNDGPRAHVIRARRKKVLKFVGKAARRPGSPVRGGRVIFARQVNWRPGAGVARNKGWFTRTANQANWLAALRQVIR